MSNNHFQFLIFRISTISYSFIKMIKSTRAIRSCSAFLILVVTLVLYLTQDNKQLNQRQRFIRAANIKTGNVSGEIKDDYKMMKVWISSSISVFIISAVGLLGVAVVPLVQKVFYNKIIQYLVALAVGSLTGDAFLHLMPHAMLGAHEDAAGGSGDEEFIAVMKGLVALGGVFFFFFAEKCLSMVSDYRAEKRAEEEERQRQLKDPRRSEIRRLSAMNAVALGNRRGSHMNNARDSAMFRRLSKVNPNDMEEDTIMTTGLSSRAMKSIDNLIRFAELDVDEDHHGSFGHGLQSGMGGHLVVPGTTVCYYPSTDDETEERKDGEIQLMVPSPGYTHVISNEKEEESVKHETHGTQHVTIVNDKDDERKHSSEDHIEVKDKKGGHGHSHSHEVPGSIAAVAWMVIFGDGLHNFSDGLAIGAAFADKISGGISTAVAVFCHELPHELGDFAVLLKTGMKVKQALFYNIVSSILSFMGMCIGIALHNVENASYWIFAITAGTFVYIALVDMLPELNSVEIRPGESRIMHLVIQNLGLITGVGVMLLIAIYEERIKSMLD